MSRCQTITTVYHDGRFWVALIERLDGDAVEIARHVFGPEPGNAELLDWAETRHAEAVRHYGGSAARKRGKRRDRGRY